MNRFSIILPVRNGGSYVKECVQSILAQTLADFNLIVLDNCSTDGTLEWLQSFKDARIVLYPSSNSLTIEENWHRITTVPKNEFMTMIGHDDLLAPDYLLTMEQLISKHPSASLYQTHFNYIDAGGKFIRPCLPMAEIQYGYEFLACHLAQTLDSMGTGYMMRSKDYDMLGGIPNYPDLIFADYELWIKLISINYKATSLSSCFSYRLHQSLSSTTKGKNYQQSFHLYILFLKKTMELDEKFVQVITRYGKQMLYFYCEKISHRLLKTPSSDGAMRVEEFTQQCKTYAHWIIPDQQFKPEKITRIHLAKIIDQNMVAKLLFLNFKRLMAKFKKK